jgi:hypothetical protein
MNGETTLSAEYKAGVAGVEMSRVDFANAQSTRDGVGGKSPLP